MRKKEQFARDQHEKRKQPNVTNQAVGQAISIGLPGSFAGSVGDTSVQAYAARLRDTRFGIAQRQALGRKLGQLGGNRYLQRVLVQMTPDVTEPLDTNGVIDVPITTIREKPDEASNGIARVRKGVTLSVKEKITKTNDETWYKVEYQGKEGFVFLWDIGVGTSPAQPAAAPSANDWMSIIPDAVSRTGRPLPARAGGDFATGGLTVYENFTTRYRPNPMNRRQEVATAGSLAPGVTQDQVDQSVAAIKEARDAIHERYLKRRYKVGQAGTGFSTLYGGERKEILAAKGPKDPGLVSDIEVTERYQTWLGVSSAKQSDVEQPEDKRPETKPTLVSDPKDIRWLVFKRIFPMEGDPSTVMTYDETNITWGVGFSGHGGKGSGQTEDMMTRLFNQSPDAAEVFWEAGLTVVDNQPVVVDTDRGWKLHGQDAELYIRANKQLLSLMVNVTQGEFIAEDEAPIEGIPSRGERLRQGVLDAQFETFLNNTLRGQNLSGWDVDAAAMAAHGVHSGQFSWGEFRNSLPANVQYIKYKLTRMGHPSWFPMIVPKEWRHHAP